MRTFVLGFLLSVFIHNSFYLRFGKTAAVFSCAAYRQWAAQTMHLLRTYHFSAGHSDTTFINMAISINTFITLIAIPNLSVRPLSAGAVCNLPQS